MGISDRDYLRDFRPRPGRVVLWIIGATVVAYFVQGLLLGRLRVDVIEVFGVVPARLVERFWVWQLVTHAFLHAPTGIWHLLFNMLFLYWFGTDVAEVYGPRRFLLLYFGGASLCAVAHTVAAFAMGAPNIHAIGASGAILAVCVVAAHLFPTRQVLIMFVLPVPLWLLVLAYVAMDLYYPLVGMQPWVASAGHLGGAIFGFLFYRLRMGRPRFSWLTRPFEGLLSRKPRPSREEVDRILDKINAQGIGSLTDRERDILKRASE
ncbi:MAG: rhomboid family intramembrane serine protease [Planctomycetes bacterium]|nr:rhomboid family intramembrane serine protease [Planctomycetota bacterium]